MELAERKQKSLIEQNSGKIISNINKKLDYLICWRQTNRKKNKIQLRIGI